MRIALVIFVVLLFRAAPAAADLYRWIDPESGAIKYSSYPPPWYGDAAAERGAPKVELIPDAKESAARAGTAVKAQDPGRALEILENQRKAILQRLPGLAAQDGSERAGSALRRQLEVYASVAGQIDKLDPTGAAVRRGEMQMVMEKIGTGALR